MAIKYNKSSEDYWRKRNSLTEQKRGKQTDKLLMKMRTLYRNTLEDINREIQLFYGRYAEENGLTLAEANRRLNSSQLKSAIKDIEKYYKFASPEKIGLSMSRKYREKLRLLSARAYMSRLEEAKTRIEHIIVRMAADQKSGFEDALKEVYKESRLFASFGIDKARGVSAGYSAPDRKTVDRALNEQWLGGNYSDRIWADKGRLVDSIDRELLTGISLGHNPKKIALAISSKFSMNYRNCERLALTEAAHITESATADSYREHGIEKYKFISGLDGRVCPECGALDGQVFELKYKEEGVNYPPIHPRCACTTAPYFEPDEIDAMQEGASRVAYSRDGKIYSVPADMTYSEWRKMTEGGN